MEYQFAASKINRLCIYEKLDLKFFARTFILAISNVSHNQYHINASTNTQILKPQSSRNEG